MSLMDIIERFTRRTRHVAQAMNASNASQRANAKEAESEARLLRFDNDLQQMDETLNRLRDQGALLD